MSKSASRLQKDREHGLNQLQREHENLEDRLESLNRPLALSAEEEVEMRAIKKRKLAIKDRLRVLQTL